MFRYYSFDNSITIFWDRQGYNGKYVVTVGDKSFVTSSTHFCLDNLPSNAEYVFCVRQCDDDKIVAEQCLCTQPNKKIIDVTQPPYCAVGDGITLNTKSLQSALDNCNGNCMVYFPKGEYLSGALFVGSNTELYLDEGAYLVGSTQVDDYLPMIDSRFEGYEMKCFASLINIGRLDHNSDATTCNVVIRGKGGVIGGGQKLCQNTIDYEKQLGLEGVEGRTRGRLINISNAKDVIVDGLLLARAPSWNVHFVYSQNVITAHCRFESFGIHNGDGWDPDSAIDCTLFDCTFDVGDDCVAVKSGKNPEGNIIARPCRNVSVFDCKTERGHGFSIGSELSGGVQGVSVWDCDFAHTLYGLHLKTTAKRGGYVKDVFINNCIFSNVNIHTVRYNDDGESSNQITVMENIQIQNSCLLGICYLDSVRNEPCNALQIDNADFVLNNVTFSNVTIKDASLTDINQVTSCKAVNVENLVCSDNLI